MEYLDFIDSKKQKEYADGFDVPLESFHGSMKDFQKVITKRAIKKGRFGIFGAPGTGKTFMQTEWAEQIINLNHKSKKKRPRALIVAPWSVSWQTVEEGEKFGYKINLCRSVSDLQPGINITNYERVEQFDMSEFIAVVLDESSILKSYDGHYRQYLTEVCNRIPYRLSCTATPAPNDYMELGTQAEFLGVMTRVEMLATYFVHDGGNTSKWRLKRHAEKAFWEWVASWAVMFEKPSDIGFSDEGYILPELEIIEHVLPSNHIKEGNLFPMPANTLTEQRAAKKVSLPDRVAACADLINGDDNQWAVWCHTNDEADALEVVIEHCKEVRGTDKPEDKTSAAQGFVKGEIKNIVSKPSIFGWGMNWQHCARQAFVGVDHSYEMLYQTIKRSHRYNQTRKVEIHLFLSETELPILENVKRKEAEAAAMLKGMCAAMADITRAFLNGEEIKSKRLRPRYYRSNQHNVLINHDCVLAMLDMDSDSIDFSVFSPPFSGPSGNGLYVYSDSDYDMGNSKNGVGFFEQFAFFAPELFRIMKPGRLIAVDCCDVPTMKERDGVIGLYDFPSYLRDQFEKVGFIFHSRVFMWKNPATEMQRTKTIGLLHKQLMKDSNLSRQGIGQQLIVMRKPGLNAVPLKKDRATFSVEKWRKYASPTWNDIDFTDTLNTEKAEKDEKHITPMALPEIARCIELWSNKGEVVFSPFAGIGSEGYQAILMGRKFIGIELKVEYWRQAIKNIQRAEEEVSQTTLLDMMTDESETDIEAGELAETEEFSPIGE